jgi:hypothetical protein
VRREIFEKWLATSPENGKSVRSFRSTNIELLERIWTQGPMDLDVLHLTRQWFENPHYDGCVARLLKAQHPDTKIQRLIMSLPKWPQCFGGNVKNTCFLPTSEYFRTLTALDISFPTFDCDLDLDLRQQLLENLRCPELEELIYWPTRSIPRLGTMLPKPKSLQICDYETIAGKPELFEETPGTDPPSQVWTELQHLKGRGIQFRHSWEGKSLTLLPWVFYNGFESQAMVFWFLDSEHTLQREDHFVLNLSALSTKQQMSLIYWIKKWQDENGLQLTLGADEEWITYPMTNGLGIYIEQRVSSTVLVKLLRRFSGLRSLTIMIFDAQETEETMYRFKKNQWCFTNEPKFPWLRPGDDEWGEINGSFRFTIQRNLKGKWEYGEPFANVRGEWIFHEMSSEKSVEYSELESEIAGRLFGHNSTLERIKVILSGYNEYRWWGSIEEMY